MLIRSCTSADFDEVHRLCRQFNDGARRLYESLGMRPQRTFMIKDL